MRTCEEIKLLIPESLVPGCDDEIRRKIEEHCARCPVCAREYEENLQLAAVLTTRERPELSDSFWDRWDERLERELDIIDHERNSGRIIPITIKPDEQWRFWKTASAVAAVFILGIAVGRFFPGSGAPDRTASNIPVKPVSAVTADAMRFLDRSKLVLLGMDVAETAPAEDFTPEYRRLREISRELLRESPTLQARLGETNQVRLAALLNELDFILIQIANMDERHESQDLELILTGMERKGLLFKIGLETIITDSMNESPAADHDGQGRL